MHAKVGDAVIVESEKVGHPARRGIVEEVLTPNPQRLRVRWEDGHSTVLAPAAGSARVEPR